MEKSLIVLASGVVCFIAGFLIFAIALFSHLDNVDIFAGIGLTLIVVFLILTYISMYMRNKEKASGEAKEKN